MNRRRVGTRKFRGNFNELEAFLNGKQCPARAPLKRYVDKSLSSFVRKNYLMRTREHERFIVNAIKRAKFGYKKNATLRNESQLFCLKTVNAATDRRNESQMLNVPLLPFAHKKQQSLVMPGNSSFIIRSSQKSKNLMRIKNNSIEIPRKQSRLQELLSDRTFDTDEKINSKIANKALKSESHAASLASEINRKKCMAKRLSLFKQSMVRYREPLSTRQLPLISISTKKIVDKTNLSAVPNTIKLFGIKEDDKEVLARLRKKFHVEDTRITLIPTLRSKLPILRFAVYDVQFQT
eukprot:TRINITY_DN738_c0_g3_i4.p1 TRINITY_DN738_c0_g3~~TRINITY_DN738_c0_g3_i4.p1  ORF type:complete len:294 (+),score=31.29 TRINITY_DN738_c0_g3_i4:339-1220(+)